MPSEAVCDYHDWPINEKGWHTSPPDPEGVEGSMSVYCPLFTWKSAPQIIKEAEETLGTDQ